MNFVLLLRKRKDDGQIEEKCLRYTADQRENGDLVKPLSFLKKH